MRSKVYVAFAVFPLLVGALGIFALLNAPYLGFKYELRNRQWIVADVEQGSPARNAAGCIGARIVSINGMAPGEFDLISDIDVIPTRAGLQSFYRFQKHLNNTVKIGRPVVLRYAGQGKGEAEVSVVPGRFPLIRVLERTGILFVLALVCLAIGLAVAINKPRDGLARVFFFLLFTVSLVFFTFGGWASRDLTLAPVPFWILFLINDLYAFPYFPVFFLHFCLVFPVRNLFRRVPVALLYAVPPVLLALFLPRIQYELYQLFWLAGLAGGAIVLAINYFRCKVPQYRAQIKWVLWGTVIFSSGMILTYSIPLLSKSLAIYNYLLPSLFFVFIPLSIAFAISRYRLLDIDTLFDNTFVYLVTLSVLLLLDGSVSGFFAWLNSTVTRVPQPIPLIISIWLIILTYIPLRSAIHRFIKRLFRRELYDVHNEAVSLSTQLLRMGEPKSIIEFVLGRIATTLHPRQIEIALFDGQLAAEVPVMLADREERPFLCDLVRSNRKPVHSDFIDAAEKKLPGFSGLLVPLRTQAVDYGAILLGDKQSGNYYTTRDHAFIAMIAGYLCMALENVRQRNELRRKELEAVREHARISRDIHDSVGSSFSSAIMTISMLEDHAPAGVRPRLHDLGAVLKRGLAELRHLIWTVDDENGSLEDCIAYLRDLAAGLVGGSSIGLAFRGLDGDCPEISVAAPVRMCLVRILQESISNALKHSGAHHLTVGFRCNGEQLEMSITDDGSGFALEQGTKTGHGLRNISRRSAEIGAHAAITSSPGNGTAITVVIPGRVLGG